MDLSLATSKKARHHVFDDLSCAKFKIVINVHDPLNPKDIQQFVNNFD
ncbi:hypothetical protein GCM10027044_15550 [Hymenobacter ruber]